MYELELFAGAGGGILGGILCGHTCVGAVELEEYPRKVLLQRQKDGILPEFPVWDNVQTFRIDNPECREYIEFLRSIREQLCISGGFPCQDISAAGTGGGIKQGTRFGMWFEMARIIDEIRPARVFVENSPILTSRGLGIVLGDLAQMGYNASWGVLGAVDVGAPHKRERIWISATLADSVCKRTELQTQRQHSSKQKLRSSSKTRSYESANTNKVNDDNSGYDSSPIQRERSQKTELSGSEDNVSNRNNGNVERIGKLRESESTARTRPVNASGEWWAVEPELGGVANGVANRVDRLKAIGNGQVSAVVKLAWELLT